MEEDEKGEWTFTGGRGGSVIDYVVGNEETREGVRKLSRRKDGFQSSTLNGIAGRGEKGKRK